MICDVSRHQGKIDWAKLAPELDLVFIKASGLYENGPDTFYARNVAEAVSRGVPFHTYHYLYCLTESEAKRDAALFYRTVAAEGHWPLTWTLDCEKGWGIVNSRAKPVAEAFEAELRRLCREKGPGEIRVAVYIGHQVYTAYALDYSHYDFVWIPRYGSNTGTISGSIRPDYPCDLWQYTSKGRIQGIPDDVDLNVLTGTKLMSFFTGQKNTEKKGDDTMFAIDKVIGVAEAELGYLEKKSNKDLDDKTANAGDKNYTKYNRDMKAWAGSAGINDQWCQNFVDWVFVTAFGLELAKKLIYTFTNYTPTGSNAFKKKDRYIKRGKGTPKRGDVIYFFNSSKGRIGHVGIVYKVTSSKVYTIEGNTSGASTLVTNGGGVKKKSYSLTSTYIDGYGSVDYSVITGDIGEAPATLKLGDRELKNYTEGPDVKELQETLISMGYDCGSFGADGEYGDCTEMAVRAFQKDTGVKVNGKYDADTHKALTAALDKQKSETEPEKAQYVQIQKNRKCYVRTAPSTDGKALGVAHSEDKLPYQGQTSENGWLLVSYTPKGETIPTNAWVSGKYGKLVS
ncbi:MAG: peptidoglycan-binding protein [Oscillospiraceae bacterium]|nr:peptidoglycan-binding protein [Oscillospiraceae bacterium]